MRVIDRLIGAVRPASEPPVTRDDPARQHGSRELLRIVLHDTLHKHGIPADWVGCEVFTGAGGSVHWRLQFLQWDPRLLAHAPALEAALRRHLLGVDPESRDWLTSITWQFALRDASLCPAMPAPASWVEERRVTRQRREGIDAARENLNRMLARVEPDLPPQLDTLPPSWAPTQPAKV